MAVVNGLICFLAVSFLLVTMSSAARVYDHTPCSAVPCGEHAEAMRCVNLEPSHLTKLVECVEYRLNNGPRLLVVDVSNGININCSCDFLFLSDTINDANSIMFHDVTCHTLDIEKCRPTEGKVLGAPSSFAMIGGQVFDTSFTTFTEDIAPYYRKQVKIIGKMMDPAVRKMYQERQEEAIKQDLLSISAFMDSQKKTMSPLPYIETTPIILNVTGDEGIIVATTEVMPVDNGQPKRTSRESIVANEQETTRFFAVSVIIVLLLTAIVVLEFIKMAIDWTRFSRHRAIMDQRLKNLQFSQSCPHDPHTEDTE